MDDRDDYVPEHCIIALIGPAGCGKRTLISRALKLFDEDANIGILPASVVGGYLPDFAMGAFTVPIPGWQFTMAAGIGMMLGVEGADAERTGFDRMLLEERLRAQHLIAPMHERAVLELRERGKTVHAVRVVAMHRGNHPMHACDADPLERAHRFRADLTIENVLDTEGLKMAVNHLAYLISMWTDIEPSRTSASASF